MVFGPLAGVLGLIVSFAADVASGGAIVLISLGIFVACVALKKLRRSKSISTEVPNCEFADDDLLLGSDEAKREMASKK